MAEERPAKGAIVGEKYRLDDLVGEGAMGQVWAAENVRTERRVALKLMRSIEDVRARARMLREARAAGRIVHRNVVEIFDAGETNDGQPFLVMPLLTGETLAVKLRREHALTNEMALHVAVEIVSGLAAAHSVGVVHRDLKPANVFLHEDPFAELPIVKLLDFGVSKILSEEETTNRPIGSPAYMSPEQIRAQKVDQRSDFWSLGVLMYEAVSGSIPYDASDFASLVYQIMQGTIRPLRERVPDADLRLEMLVSACLIRDPATRVGSAMRLLRLLGADEARGLPGDKTLVEESPATIQTAADAAPQSPVRSPEAYAETGRAPQLPSIFETNEDEKR
jgi:serine/threonine protein kinase